MTFLTNLKTKIADTKKSVIDSIELVDAETSSHRMQVCLECPFLSKTLGQCEKCGCFMRAKTKLKTASCPLKKW
jgi:hypothetical protein